MGDTSGNGTTPGAEFTSDAYTSARRWQVIWPQVIALIWEKWNNPELIKALNDDPHGTLERWFGYKLSKELRLTVKKADENNVAHRFSRADYDAALIDANTTCPPKDAWKDLPKMELTLYVPPPPAAGDEAIAIAAYSDTGRTYPMTSG